MNRIRLHPHWFLVAAPLILAGDVFAVGSARGDIDRLLEAGLLLDLAVVIPGLYGLCYRPSGRQAFVKFAAGACLGIWAALQLVPEPERDLLNHVAPLRHVGLAVLVALECGVVVAIYRAVQRGGTVDEAASGAPAGVPPWVARLLAFEARLWFKAWRAIKRRLGLR